MVRDKESKLICCYEIKYGNNSREGSCECSQESAKYNDDKELQRLQKESEEELERARQMLQKTENSTKQNRTGCVRMTHTPMSKSPSKTGIPIPRNQYKSGPVNENREAIKRLTKVPMGRGSDSADGRCPGMSGGRTTNIQKMLPHCPPPSEMEKDSKELPKKPKLTTEELGALLDQETRDVESAWILTTDTRESFKRPCPKQQKARDAVKALVEPKKEEPPPPPPPPPPREPVPFLDPDPDDITPEVAANMMYTQERGIKMISCPEETVRHLFAEQLGNEDKDLAREGDTDGEVSESDLDETAELDDAVFTRNMKEKDTENDPDKGDRDNVKKNRRDRVNAESSTEISGTKTEFVLQGKEAKCVNRVQLRGNCAPWFPGYYVALPGQVGDSSIQVAKSPSGIFQKAWMAAKPTNVPSTDLYVVE